MARRISPESLQKREEALRNASARERRAARKKKKPADEAVAQERKKRGIRKIHKRRASLRAAGWHLDVRGKKIPMSVYSKRLYGILDDMDGGVTRGAEKAKEESASAQGEADEPAVKRRGGWGLPDAKVAGKREAKKLRILRRHYVLRQVEDQARRLSILGKHRCAGCGGPLKLAGESQDTIGEGLEYGYWASAICCSKGCGWMTRALGGYDEAALQPGWAMNTPLGREIGRLVVRMKRQRVQDAVFQRMEADGLLKRADDGALKRAGEGWALGVVKFADVQVRDRYDGVTLTTEQAIILQGRAAQLRAIAGFLEAAAGRENGVDASREAWKAAEVARKKKERNAKKRKKLRKEKRRAATRAKKEAAAEAVGEKKTP